MKQLEGDTSAVRRNLCNLRYILNGGLFTVDKHESQRLIDYTTFRITEMIESALGGDYESW